MNAQDFEWDEGAGARTKTGEARPFDREAEPAGDVAGALGSVVALLAAAISIAYLGTLITRDGSLSRLSSFVPLVAGWLVYQDARRLKVEGPGRWLGAWSC